MPDVICIPALTAVSVVGCDLFVLVWISMQLRDLVIEFARRQSLRGMGGGALSGSLRRALPAGFHVHI